MICRKQRTNKCELIECQGPRLGTCSDCNIHPIFPCRRPQFVFTPTVPQHVSHREREHSSEVPQFPFSTPFTSFRSSWRPHSCLSSLRDLVGPGRSLLNQARPRLLLRPSPWANSSPNGLERAQRTKTRTRTTLPRTPNLQAPTTIPGKVAYLAQPQRTVRMGLLPRRRPKSIQRATLRRLILLRLPKLGIAPGRLVLIPSPPQAPTLIRKMHPFFHLLDRRHLHLRRLF